MATVKVQLRSIAGTEAAAGWVGGHSIVVDRPEGKAGGTGLGFGASGERMESFAKRKMRQIQSHRAAYGRSIDRPRL